MTDEPEMVVEQATARFAADLDARFAVADDRISGRFDRLGVQLLALESKLKQERVAASAQIAKLEAKLDAVLEALKKNE